MLRLVHGIENSGFCRRGCFRDVVEYRSDFCRLQSIRGPHFQNDNHCLGISKKQRIAAVSDSMQTIGKQAVTVTESTKQRIAEFEPVLARAQDSYSRTLDMVDSKLAETAKEIDSSALKIRDAVAKPAVSTMAFVAGLTKVFESIRDE